MSLRVGMMGYNHEKHHRRSIRLKDYDYRQEGAYFVTICTQEKLCLFGDVLDDLMVLNDAGKMIESALEDLCHRFEETEIDVNIVMPNHCHAVIISGEIECRGESCIRPELGLQEGDHKDRPYHDFDDRTDENEDRYKHPCGTEDGSLGRVVQAFKSITTVEYVRGVKQNGWEPFPGRLWQKNYYERIIRNNEELNRIREYISGNPQNWATDEENPINVESKN